MQTDHTDPITERHTASDSQYLRISVKYVDNNGSPIDTHSLHQGTDFMAVVTVANISGTTDYTNLALTHIICRMGDFQ